jgi:hypothetical protein
MPLLLLQHGEARRFLVELALQEQEVVVADAGHGLEVADPLGLGFVDLEPLALGLELADLRDDGLLLLPVLLEHGQLAAQALQLVVQPGEPRLRGLVGLLREADALDLELPHAAVDLVQLDRHGVDLHPQARGGLVDQVDGLVGQVAVGDVAAREHRRGDERGVLDTDAVVHLVALLEAAQDRDRVLHARLAHEHGLESARRARRLFDVLPIFVQGSSRHAMQLPRARCRLQQIAGVHRPLGAAGSDERCAAHR